MRDNFNVLMSVYSKDSPKYFSDALQSIYKLQTVKPAEIVLVKDGPLCSELEEVIRNFSANYQGILTLVSLKQNAGLGNALKEGMKHCKYDWIARMDSDDLSDPKRFEKQMSYLEENPDIDILGGWICEFGDNPKICVKEKRVPGSYSEIAKYAKYRNPMNHVTVVFRKSAVEVAGGYKPMNGFEDYYLWMRMLISGNTFANLEEIVVKVRAGREMIRRRQGWQYTKDEWKLEKEAWRIGFWSSFDLLKNLFVRILPRLMPLFMVEKLYNFLRKTNGHS